MGSRLGQAARREISVRVRGADAIDRIELLRNGRVIATHCHQGTWDLEGRILTGPAGGAMRAFYVNVKADRVRVHLRRAVEVEP